MRYYNIQYLDITGNADNYQVKCTGKKKAKELFLMSGIQYNKIIDVYLIQC